MSEKVVFYPDYWAGKKLAYPHVPAEAPKFSRSVVAGNLIFVSGCEGLNDETGELETDVFEEQMIIALDKVRYAMEEAGSSMNNIIKTLMLLKHLDDYPACGRRSWSTTRIMLPFWWRTPRPARSWRSVSRSPAFCSRWTWSESSHGNRPSAHARHPHISEAHRARR